MNPFTPFSQMPALFRSLLSKRRAQPASAAATYLQLLGLKRQEALALRTLSNEPGWRALLKALDSIISLRAEEMLRLEDSSTLHFYRGRITGLREVPNLVDEIVSRLEQLEATDERSRQQQHLRHDPERVATFGTPAWPSS
jgi:hypothetical protein